ncbi:uncharacterized protein [Cherax quadricarinatus]|uniref:uncharacterized protein n=1 Tax=Cherax quadricarinatus TaxID=27406 RepID=UPI00387E6508
MARNVGAQLGPAGQCAWPVATLPPDPAVDRAAANQCLPPDATAGSPVLGTRWYCPPAVSGEPWLEPILTVAGRFQGWVASGLSARSDDEPATSAASSQDSSGSRHGASLSSSTCVLYNRQFWAKGDNTDVHGWKTPVWTDVSVNCLGINSGPTASGYPGWGNLFSGATCKQATDCPCSAPGSGNWVGIDLGYAQNVTSVQVTTSFAPPPLAINTNIYLGPTMTSSDPLVAALSNNPKPYTVQTFNMFALGRKLTIQRTDGQPLCLCQLQIMLH